LINNTGGPPAGPIVDAKEEDFLQAFNQHLVCNHILAKAVIPACRQQDMAVSSMLSPLP
jgi:3-oxoacyl-[acyl-carrier protein] reductase